MRVQYLANILAVDGMKEFLRLSVLVCIVKNRPDLPDTIYSFLSGCVVSLSIWFAFLADILSQMSSNLSRSTPIILSDLFITLFIFCLSVDAMFPPQQFIPKVITL
ncbi:hypothetical protein EGW08_012847, partial [Elysia chlorotica]